MTRLWLRRTSASAWRWPARESLRLDPSDVEAYFDLGLVETALGNASASLASFDAALQLNPAHGVAHAARAQVLFAIGRYEEARRDVRAAQEAKAEVDPDLVAKLARMR